MMLRRRLVRRGGVLEEGRVVVAAAGPNFDDRRLFNAVHFWKETNVW